MVEFVKDILRGQFEAALCMLNQCVEACPPELWEVRIANDTFRQVVYHTLFYVDLYLSPTEEAFVPREDVHHEGGDERGPMVSPGLPKKETLAYLAMCRQKMIDILAAETAESLAGPSGFSWRKFSRAELHVYNLRHIQHHTGQMSAFLRRLDPASKDPKALPWVGRGCVCEETPVLCAWNSQERNSV